MPTQLTSLANQVRQIIWDAVTAWSFLPILAATINYGEVTLCFHGGQLRDVTVEFKSKGPPK